MSLQISSMNPAFKRHRVRYVASHAPPVLPTLAGSTPQGRPFSVLCRATAPTTQPDCPSRIAEHRALGEGMGTCWTGGIKTSNMLRLHYRYVMNMVKGRIRAWN